MNRPVQRLKVAICICTYRRPDVLTTLLDRMKAVADATNDVATVGVVVIDDDRERSAHDVATAHSADFELGVEYRCTGSGNISTARNAALEAGCNVGEFLALIDDDCVPEPDWVAELVRIQRDTGADFVSGRCYDRPPPDPPSWLVDEPFLEDPPAVPDGDPIVMGYVKNLLVSSEAVRRHDLRFDLEYGHLGGEDAMFFYAARAAGVVHRHAALAIVSEEVPPHRASMKYRLRRSFWYGSTESMTTIAAGLATRRRATLRGVRTSANAIARPFSRLARRERPQLRFALAQFLRGIGRVLGGLGFRFRHR